MKIFAIISSCLLFSFGLLADVTQQGKPAAVNANAVIVPAVAHADGLNSHWQSDLSIYNPDSPIRVYDLYFTPSGVDGTQNGWLAKISAPGRATVALDDVLSSTFQLQGSLIGALEIRPESAAATIPVVTSRTYNTSSSGTLGEALPAVPVTSFAKRKHVMSLQQLAQNTDYRTNVGVVEGAGQPVSMAVRVFDSSGAVVAQRDLDLAPYEHLQLNSLLGQYGVDSDDMRVELEITSGNGTATSYASVVDNRTNDASIIPAALPAEPRDVDHVVPGVAHLDSGSNRWRTDVAVYNANPTVTNVVINYMSSTSTNSTHTSFDMQPGEVRLLKDVVSSLFGLDDAGSLVIFAPSFGSLVVTARTYTDTGSGTFGQYVPSFVVIDGTLYNDLPLELLHVAQSSAYRTNVGLIELGGSTTIVELDVVDEFGRRASTTVTLAPRQNIQLDSLLHDLGLDGVANARIEIRVVQGGGWVAAYSSVVDNQTQDPTFFTAQKTELH